MSAKRLTNVRLSEGERAQMKRLAARLGLFGYLVGLVNERPCQFQRPQFIEVRIGRVCE